MFFSRLGEPAGSTSGASNHPAPSALPRPMTAPSGRTTAHSPGCRPLISNACPCRRRASSAAPSWACGRSSSSAGSSQQPALALGGLCERLQGGSLLDAEATRSRAPQPAQVRAAAERLADVLGQHADIGAFAANDAQPQGRAFERGELQYRDADAARRALHLLAAARQSIERRALVLQRRIHRRHLLDLAAKALQHRRQRLLQRHATCRACTTAPSASPGGGGERPASAWRGIPCRHRAAGRRTWWPRRTAPAAAPRRAGRACRRARPFPRRTAAWPFAARRWSVSPSGLSSSRAPSIIRRLIFSA